MRVEVVKAVPDAGTHHKRGEGFHVRARSVNLRVLLLGFVVSDAQRIIPQHTHDHYEFHLVTAGTCAYAYGDIVYHLEPGDLCLSKPGEAHIMRGDGTDDWQVYYMQVFPDPRSALADALERTGTHCVGGCSDLAPQFARIFDEAESPGIEWENKVLALTYALLVDCARRLGNGDRGRVELSSWYTTNTERIRWTIENRCRHGLSLDEIAEAVGASKSSVAHVFSREMQESVCAYNRRILMARAQRLLQETQMSVADIATSLGFGSAQYFSDTFRRAFGMPPGRYRRSLDQSPK